MLREGHRGAGGRHGRREGNFLQAAGGRQEDVSVVGLCATSAVVDVVTEQTTVLEAHPGHAGPCETCALEAVAGGRRPAVAFSGLVAWRNAEIWRLVRGLPPGWGP